MTRKRFKQLGRAEGLRQLSERILHNMKFASVVVKHCSDIGAVHYRIPQSFPLMTDPELKIKWSDLPDELEIISAISEIGNTARKYNIRLSCHPDQFVILASPQKEVRKKSITDLIQYGRFFDTMGLPLSHEAPINIHTSCSIKDGSSLEDIASRIALSLDKCGESVSSRFTLENEDRGSFAPDVLYDLHIELRDGYGYHIPLVLDNLHFSCNPPTKKDFKFWLNKFKSTWPKGIVPLMHWSEGGLNGNKRAHVDYITEVGKPTDNSVVWELEVKAKDKAIVKLLKG